MNRQDWRRELGVLNPGRWIQLPRDFILLGDTEAIFLTVLLNHVALEVEAKEDKNLWVKLPPERLEKKLPSYSRDKIKRLLRSLRGIVRVKAEGPPFRKRRWVLIDPSELWERILEEREKLRQGGKNAPLEEKGGKNPPLQKGEKNPPLKDVDPKEEIFPPDGGQCEKVRVKSIRLDPFRSLAERLHSAVSRVRAILSTSKPQTWAHSFRTLHKRGVPLEKLQKAMTWYEKVLREHGDLMRAGTTYLPIAYSGPKWIDKWESIEIGMEKALNPEGAERPRMNVRMLEVKRTEGSRYEWEE